jgi:ribose-phosphate pyrophosphokinase
MSITFSTRIGPGFWTTPTFEQMRFPAGEGHIKVVNENGDKGPLTEVARVYGADGNDLILLGMWANAARQRGANTVAFLPYLPGARQDRGIPFGSHVYAEIINRYGIDQVICFDPHSPVMPGQLENLTIIDSVELIRHLVVGRADSDQKPQRYTGIIAPDKGAVARAQRVADACHLPLYRATKDRNPDTGELSNFQCETLPADGRYLIVDDICDGGGTFRAVAETTGLPREQLGLWVSHGVFSGAAGKLADSFGDIWTTDSFAADPTPVTSRREAFHIVPLEGTLRQHIAAKELVLV